MGDLKPKYVRLLILGAVLISWLMHLPYLNEPPYGDEVENQAYTLAIADNFFYEDNNITLPRVDNRGASDGVTGMHFPLYEFFIAQTYTYSGDNFWVHRLWSFFFSIMAALASYYLSRLWFRSEKVAVTAFCFFLFSPIVFFTGFIALPDMMALALVLWGLVFFYQWWYKRNDFQIILSSLLFLAGGLIKLPFLGIGVIVVGTILRDWKLLRLGAWIRLNLSAFIVIVPVLLWYRYAKMMIQTSSELRIPTLTKSSFEDTIAVLSQNFYSDLPLFILGVVAFVGLIAAVYFFLKKKKRSEHHLLLPFATFLGVIIAYHLLEIKLVENHKYYLLPYLIFLVPVSAFGLIKLTRGEEKLTLGLLGLNILICGFSVMPFQFNKENPGIAKEFWDDSMRAELQTIIPKDSLIIVGLDKTNCVNFYFLKSQGWNLSQEEQLIGTANTRVLPIDSMIRSGAAYFVCNDSMLLNNPIVWSRFGEQKGQVGNYKVFSLRRLRK